MPFAPLASMFSFKSLTYSELSRFKIRVSAHEFIDHDADYAEFWTRPVPLIRTVAGRPVLPPVRTHIWTVYGEEEIQIPPIPDSEIESWPLPQSCRGISLKVVFYSCSCFPVVN